MARVNIDIGIKSTVRTNQPFRPSAILVAPFHYETEDTDYLSQTGAVASEISTYIKSQQDEGWQNSINISVTLENTTEVNMGPGIIPMPKGHRDGAMTEIEVLKAGSLEQWLNDTIAELIQRAKFTL